MSLESDIKKYFISTTKVKSTSVYEHYTVKNLLAQLEQALIELGVDDASLSAKYDEYDNPRSFSGFTVSAIVNKTTEELQAEVEQRINDEKVKKDREYKEFLRLKEKFSD